MHTPFVLVFLRAFAQMATQINLPFEALRWLVSSAGEATLSEITNLLWRNWTEAHHPSATSDTPCSKIVRDGRLPRNTLSETVMIRANETAQQLYDRAAFAHQATRYPCGNLVHGGQVYEDELGKRFRVQVRTSLEMARNPDEAEELRAKSHLTSDWIQTRLEEEGGFGSYALFMCWLGDNPQATDCVTVPRRDRGIWGRQKGGFVACIELETDKWQATFSTRRSGYYIGVTEKVVSFHPL